MSAVIHEPRKTNKELMFRNKPSFLRKIVRILGNSHKRMRRVHQDISGIKKVRVVFRGGIGAQIMSAATYWYLQEQGKEVQADMTYFSLFPFEVRPMMVDGLSYWPWNLDFLGISQQSFIESDNSAHNYSEFYTIGDNFQKFELALKALSTQKIKDKFRTSDFQDIIQRCLPAEFGDRIGYAAIHIRRGDYVNVASHVVGDQTIIAAIESVSKLIDRCVVISDSPVHSDVREAAERKFKVVSFLDSPNLSETDAHVVMQHAKFLVTSNSQYSLTAALLGNGVCLVPKVWFSGEPGFSQAIDGLGEYQLLS
jgi:hypothetical protein